MKPEHDQAQPVGRYKPHIGHAKLRRWIVIQSSDRSLGGYSLTSIVRTLRLCCTTDCVPAIRLIHDECRRSMTGRTYATLRWPVYSATDSFLQRSALLAVHRCICHGGVRLSVCLSVCPPSHAGIVSRRTKLPSCDFHRQVGQSS